MDQLLTYLVRQNILVSVLSLCLVYAEEACYTWEKVGTSSGTSVDYDYGDSIILSHTQSMGLTSDGMISSFYLPKAVHHTQGETGQVQFQIWRPTGGDSYKLIAETAFYETTNENDLYVQVPRSEPITVQKGDVLGLNVKGKSPVPYKIVSGCSGGDQIRLVTFSMVINPSDTTTFLCNSYNRVYRNPKNRDVIVGQTYSFEKTNKCRKYAFNAYFCEYSAWI